MSHSTISLAFIYGRKNEGTGRKGESLNRLAESATDIVVKKEKRSRNVTPV